jgi:hypothetical protein
MNNSTKANANKKSENGKAKIVEKKSPSIEDIKIVLDQEIVKFQRKSELIANRERFLLTKTDLQAYLSDQGVDYDDSLDSPTLRVQLYDNRKYRDDSQISIANNMIVREFIQFLIAKIDAKISEIEKEILG